MSREPDENWQRRRAWFPVKIEGRWLWLRRFEERGYKVFVERRRPEDEPDPDFRSEGSDWINTRVLVATIALIVVLAFGIAGHGIWSFAERPVPCAR